MPGVKASFGSGIEAAYYVPGLPHLVFENGARADLKAALKQAADHAQATGADVLVIYSSQWISVLGHSLQADPNPHGIHVDENWYDLGDFEFSFKVDTELAERIAEKGGKYGLAMKLVNYDGFPVDTGTLVALEYFNPENRLPVVVVSANIYAGQEESIHLGEATRQAIGASGRKAILINVSGLSHRFFTQEISPDTDRICREEDENWNQKMLELMRAGKMDEAVKLGPEFARQAQADMMFKGFYWLAGALNMASRPAKVMAYGPIWGTGACVVEWTSS